MNLERKTVITIERVALQNVIIPHLGFNLLRQKLILEKVKINLFGFNRRFFGRNELTRITACEISVERACL